jgi:glycosyltransferase involved in cell wall biosynthesis
MGIPLQVLGTLRKLRIPVVVTLHDFWWVCANAQLITNYSHKVCGGPRWGLNCAHCALARAGAGTLWPAAPLLAPVFVARRRLLASALSQAALIIAPTLFVKQWYAGQGLSPENIRVLPHGIERSQQPPVPKEAGTTVRVVYIGGLTPQKGVHVLVQALRQVKGPIELWIAGDELADPAYSRELRAHAGENVRFLGRLSRQAVWDCLAQADLVAVPSLWYETFSLIAHEAFVADRPVMASRLGALAEAVQDNVNGYLVAPGDTAAWRAALQRVVDRPGELRQLNARIRPPLSQEAHVDQLLTLYGEAMAGSERR